MYVAEISIRVFLKISFDNVSIKYVPAKFCQ